MKFISLTDADNVAVALESLTVGATVGNANQAVKIREEIAAGHKFARLDIGKGENVVKYGVSIGVCTQDIRAGEHTHLHNMKSALVDSADYAYTPATCYPGQKQAETLYFDGYRRSSGKVGTRNEIWILSTVGCVSSLTRKIAWAANELHKDECDGIFAFTHPFGCSQTGDDLEDTRLIMANLALHPNAGAVLIIGLGCEDNQGSLLLDALPESRKARIGFFNCQGVANEFAEGMASVAKLVQQIKADRRTRCSLAEMVLGVKCGASDGYSGLSANPVVGRITDTVCDLDGTVLLTEVPEMFGAEQLLMNRAASHEVFDAIVTLINNFKRYFIDHAQPIDKNPSPGNKEGGITTLAEKSMGAIQKGGNATINGVLGYTETVRERGLNLLQAPGNDAVSSTALAASGATLILFTTGRGTPLGFPVPTIKIASNSRLASAKPNWIDFDAGRVFDLDDFGSVAAELLGSIIEVASGRMQTKAEINDQREIAIWKRGVTL